METSIPISDKKITEDLLPQKFGKKGKIWTGILIVFCLAGAFGYYRQLRYGLKVTNMRDYVSWGIYISNFVFFVAISLVGSLITAVFRLADVHWSGPLTRIAEIIAVAAIIFASLKLEFFFQRNLIHTLIGHAVDVIHIERNIDLAAWTLFCDVPDFFAARRTKADELFFHSRRNL